MFCFLLSHWCEGLSTAEFGMGQKSPNVNRNCLQLLGICSGPGGDPLGGDTE